jgi:NAD(P)-dependent dehydrogenase (short-subunit alcohol dehydrogenase family)
MDGFEGKVAVVTGAASGIGRETARLFASRGARMAVADIDGDGLESLRRELEEGGREVLAVRVDVAQAQEVERFCEEVYGRFGRADVLVNNAGVGLGGLMEDLSLEDWRWLLGINLWGVIHGCHYFYPRMVEQGGGHIVNLSSAAALGFLPGLIAYNVSKYAVLGLSESLRAEAARHRVGVSAICPGIVKTNITVNSPVRSGVRGRPPEAVLSRVDRLYRRRGYPPEKVAEAIVKAVEKNKGVVPVTPETYILDLVRRLSRSLYGRIGALLVRLFIGS